jgi:hypothetical protein
MMLNFIKFNSQSEIANFRWIQLNAVQLGLLKPHRRGEF